jgi:stage IV sporulation protein FB
MGHFLVSQYYKWNIDKIYLYPFGGYIKFNTDVNKPINEELWILSMGMIFQIILYILILFFKNISIIFFSTFNLFHNYHYAILIFNLIPIFPLDGAKLLNLLLAKEIPFKLSHKIMIYISYFFLILLAIINIRYYFNISLFLICVLLLTIIIGEKKNHEHLFNKFLLERYLKIFSFKKLKILKNNSVYNMMRDKRHIFVNNNNYITEKDMLKKRFDR